MEVVLIILACFVVAVVVGTVVAMARKQRAQVHTVLWHAEATGEAPTEPPEPSPPGTSS
jgi:hypothetical protein